MSVYSYQSFAERRRHEDGEFQRIHSRIDGLDNKVDDLRSSVDGIRGAIKATLFILGPIGSVLSSVITGIVVFWVTKA